MIPGSAFVKSSGSVYARIAPGFAPTDEVTTGGSQHVRAITLRHALTPELPNVGGHIGHSIRPTSRRRDFASWALRDTPSGPTGRYWIHHA
jgi:hypothetical protein